MKTVWLNGFFIRKHTLLYIRSDVSRQILGRHINLSCTAYLPMAVNVNLSFYKSDALHYREI